jgi:hypothetical protein
MTTPTFKRRGEALDFYMEATARLMAKRSYAIGGAVAQSFYGYTRQTQDLDVFIPGKTFPRVLKTLEKEGFIIEEVFEGIHYHVHHPGFEDVYPHVRVDLLSSYDDIEWSAVAEPEIFDWGGIKVRVFPFDLLVLTRFLSDQPKHRADLLELVKLPAFNPDSTRSILRYINKGEDVPAWDAFLVSLMTPNPPNRRKRRPSG